MRPIDRLRAKKKNKTPSLKEVFTELLTVLVGFVGGVISIALGIATIFCFGNSSNGVGHGIGH